MRPRTARRVFGEEHFAGGVEAGEEGGGGNVGGAPGLDLFTQRVVWPSIWFSAADSPPRRWKTMESSWPLGASEGKQLAMRWRCSSRTGRGRASMMVDQRWAASSPQPRAARAWRSPASMARPWWRRSKRASPLRAAARLRRRTAGRRRG